MSCLVGINPTWLTSRPCRDTRVYGHTATAMHEIDSISPIEYTPPAALSPTRTRECRYRVELCARLIFESGRREDPDHTNPAVTYHKGQIEDLDVHDLPVDDLDVHDLPVRGAKRILHITSWYRIYRKLSRPLIYLFVCLTFESEKTTGRTTPDLAPSAVAAW